MSKRCAVLLGVIGMARGGRAGLRAGFLQGQDHQHPGRLLAGRRLRHQCARAGAPHGPPHSGQSHHRGAEHAGRRQPECGALPRQHRGEGRHRSQHLQFRRHRRGAAESGQDQDRFPQVQLDRQHQPGPDRLLCLACARREDARGTQGAAEGALRLDRRRQLERSQPANPEEHLRRASCSRSAAIPAAPSSASRSSAASSTAIAAPGAAFRSEWIDEKKIDPGDPVVAGDGARHAAGRARSASTSRRTSAARQIMQLLLASNQLGRPFMASAAVPAERVRILREAFAATMKDPGVHRRNAEASAAALADRRRSRAQGRRRHLRDSRRTSSRPRRWFSGLER